MKMLINEHGSTSMVIARMNRLSGFSRLRRQRYLHALAIAGLIMLATSSLRGQSVANYAPVTRTTGITYSSISATGIAIPAWRNNTPNNSTEDDNRSYPVDIGFDFWYDGIRYTQFSASTNGFMDFSSATFDGGPSSRPFGPYDADLSTNSQAGGTLLALAPCYYDMTTQGEVNPLGNSIKYLVTGSAPNKVLTVEWINMSEWPNHSSSTNFQVNLYESSGVIEFIYGSMSPGTGFTWSYTLGINGPTLSTTPTAAQLLIQQTQNSTTFSQTIQNSLATVPASNSKLTFTPPTPANPTNLTFSNVQLTSMQLNWTDNSNNEVGYVIYRSDDGGAMYNFIRQIAANSTSSNESGLLAGTTYYWKVYAVTEGKLSAALLGSQATSPAPNVISAQTGSWKLGATWVGGVVPASTANVTVADGHTVTLDSNITANSVTVGQGGAGAILTIGNDATVRTLTVNGNIDIKAGAAVVVNTGASQTGHTINITGDILNAGTINLEPSTTSRCAVNFNKNGPQNIQGGGSVTRFGKITLNMGASSSNNLDVSATNFVDTVANFLTLMNGTFRLSTGATITPFLGNISIPASAGLWLYSNSPTVTIPDGLIVAGSLRVSSGVLTIGDATDEPLMSNGGTFTIEGGMVNIAGRFAPYNNYTTTNFIMSGGTLNVPTVGSTSSTEAPFTMSVVGSYFETTGGTIVIKKSGGSNLGFLNTGSTSSSISGGTLQIGDGSTPSGQTIAVKTITPVYDFLVSGATPTVTARLDTILVVKNNVSINSGNVLNANTNDIRVAGLWNDAGSFSPSTATVTFNGTGAQTITKTSSGETFNKLTINSSGPSVSIAASTNVTVADSCQITLGTLAVGANTLTLNGVVTSAGTLSSSTTGTVSYNSSSAGQVVLAINYGNLTFSNFSKILPSSGTVGIAGAFTPGSAAGHTITGSTIDYNGAGAQSVSSLTYNNLYLSGGGTKTLLSGADTVQGTLNVGSGVTIADGGFSLRVFKDITNNGIHSGSGNITLIGGTSAHILSGTGLYTNVIVNDANGASLSNDLTIDGALTFTNGIITTSASKLIIASSGSVIRASGHVNGNLQKSFSAGNLSATFEVGDASVYAPVIVSFSAITTPGDLIVNTTAGDHPDIANSGVGPTTSVNRYWTMTNNGIAFTTYDATFNFVAGDLDGGTTTGTFIVAQLDAAWSLPTVGTRTATTTQALGMNSIYASGSSFVVGNVATVATNSYRSVATGNWNAIATWQRYNGTTWVAAVATPTSASANITLQSPFVVTVTANVTVDQLEVKSGAQLIVNAGITLTVANGAGTDLTLGGTLTNNGTLSQGTSVAVVPSGGYYKHNTANTANLIATWDANSTCEFSGVTATIPANRAQAFGHFIWNCPSQSAALSMGGTLATVAGNFTVISTGSSELRLGTTTSQTTTVGGNYSQSGGTFALSTGTGASPIFDIAGNFSVTGGTLRLKGNGGAQTGTTTLRVAGNFSHTAGTISENSTSTNGKAQIVFDGIGIQTYTSGGTIAATDSIGFTVNNGATLYLGISVITGGGLFTLSSGATLGIGSTAGITTSGATGNIQTGVRSYSSSAGYIYNGSATQSTGNGLPSTVNRLSIGNSSGVNLTNSLTTDSLYLVAGAFNVNSGVTLTLNNIASVTSGSLTSAPTGTVNYNKSADGQTIFPGSYGNLTFSNFAKVFPSSDTVAVATTFTPGTSMTHTLTGSTIWLQGVASQTLPAYAYNNLRLSNGWYALTANTLVQGSFSLLSGVLSDSLYTLTLSGNVVNSGTHRGSGKIFLNGSLSAHLISGGGAFGNVELDDGNGAAVTGNVYFNGTLTLTRGIITTGSDTLVINNGGNVNRAVTGLARHIFGNMKRYVASGSPIALTFQIGDASNYTPLDVTFASVSVAGYLAATTVGSNHPNIGISGFDITKNVSRNWTVRNLGITFTAYDITPNFVSGDVAPAANSAAFFVRRYTGVLWKGPTTTTRTSSSTKAVGLTTFGDFAVGELLGYFRWTGLGGDIYWNNPDNWSLNAVPTTLNDVILDTTAVIDNISADSCKNLTIANSGLQLTVTSGSLAVMGNLGISNGTLSTQSAFPFVNGTVTLSGGAVAFTGTGAQTVPALNYYDLNISGTRTTSDVTLASGTLSVANSFTPTATFTTGRWINAGNTFQYAGSGAQTVAAIDYNNLSIMNARAANNVTFSSADTIAIAGTLTTSATFNSGYGYILTGTIVDYNGTGSQTVQPMPYHTLRISGARTTNTVTLSSSDTIHVANIFNPVATFTGVGGYQPLGTIFEYNGSGTQDVSAFTYNDLVLTNGNASAKTFTGIDSIKGNLVINANATAAGGSGSIVLFGNWTNSGSFAAGTSTVEFGGIPSTVVAGATTFDALTINKADSATTITLNNNLNVGTLNMTLGTMQTGSNSMTISGTRTGNGLILGTVTRTHTFALSTPYAFEGPNTLINFTAGSTPSSVTITAAQITPASPTMIPVDRSISISTTGGSFTATLRLHYENSETNDLDELGLRLWKDSSGTWRDRGATTRDSVNNYVELTGITAFSSWAIGASASSKTLVDNNGGSVNAGDTLSYTVTIVNPYKSTKPTLDVSDALSSNFILVPGTISNSGAIAGQVLTGMNLEGGTITWPSFSLAGGASVTRTFQLRSDSTISPSQTIVNTALINYGGGNVEYVSVPVTLTNLPNIAITNAVDNTKPVPGDVLTYTLSVRNNGTSNATNITLNTAIPDNTTFNANGYGAGLGVQVDGVGKTNASDGDGVTYSGGSITVTISTLAPGITTQIKFKTTVN